LREAENALQQFAEYVDGPPRGVEPMTRAPAPGVPRACPC